MPTPSKAIFTYPNTETQKSNACKASSGEEEICRPRAGSFSQLVLIYAHPTEGPWGKGSSFYSVKETSAIIKA